MRTQQKTVRLNLCTFSITVLISLIISLAGLHVFGQSIDGTLDDPNMRLVTWLHIVPHGEDFEAQHQQYLHYYKLDSRNFIVLKNETYHHPRKGVAARRYFWSSAMAGIHTQEAYIHANDGDETTLKQMGFVNRFMEQTPFHRMVPRDDLSSRSTKWILARQGEGYIAYSYEYLDNIGLKGLAAGTYDLLWMDTESGQRVKQSDINLNWGNAAFAKPESFGSEVVVYIKRQAGE